MSYTIMEIGTHESINLTCIHKQGSIDEGMVWCKLGHDASRCDVCQYKDTKIQRTVTTFVNV